MKRRLAFFFATAFMAIAFLGTAGTLPAKAAIGPGDDRQMTTPTNWWTYTGVTTSQIESLRVANNARLTDLEVDDPAGSTFTVVMVRNTGAYASSWWYYVDETQSEVSAHITANNGRLISAEAYKTSSGVRYAVVMVKNTGANAEAWWWYHGSVSALSSQLATHHARLVDVSPYPGGGYLAIMVDDAGANAVSGGWWWYVGATTSSISSDVSRNHARLVDLSRNSNGTWNAIMYHDTSTRWYWYVNFAPSSAVDKVTQLGERIIDATPYTVGRTKYYAVVATDDLDAPSDALWRIIGPKVDSGAYGFYLKLVGGSTLAALESTKQYEPASALKVLYHAKSIHAESLRNTTDGTVITYHYNPADPTNGGICPDSYPNTRTTNLKNADTLMMQASDDRMTRGVLEKYTKATILSYGSALGLTSTAINHNIGCPTPTTHNKTTLVDLGKVYEAYEKGVITTSSKWKGEFASRMLTQSNYTGFKNSICPIVQQEAMALGKSSTVATSFCNAMTWIAKGGSYQYGSLLPYTVSWGGLSLTGVPYKSGGVAAPKYFVFGEYVDGTQINSQGEANSVNAARSKLYQEAIRPYIHAALAGW